MSVFARDYTTPDWRHFTPEHLAATISAAWGIPVTVTTRQGSRTRIRISAEARPTSRQVQGVPALIAAYAYDANFALIDGVAVIRRPISDVMADVAALDAGTKTDLLHAVLADYLARHPTLPTSGSILVDISTSVPIGTVSEAIPDATADGSVKK